MASDETTWSGIMREEIPTKITALMTTKATSEIDPRCGYSGTITIDSAVPQ